MPEGRAVTLEDEIRDKCLRKRLRIREFFLDYDMLRSGFVTRDQFFRVLSENLQSTYTADQQNYLFSRYNVDGTGRMYYKLFADVIDCSFDPSDLKNNPVLQKVEPTEYFGTDKTIRPLSPNSEERLKTMLTRLVKFYKNRGFDIRQAFSDFDRHNLGKVTESQFYRNLPKPPELGEEQVYLLVTKYRDPMDVGMVIYMNMYNDLLALEMAMDDEARLTFDKSASKSGAIPREIQVTDPSLQDILEKMRVMVHKNGIRTTPFFRDYDRLRTGKVPESQFVAALMLACGKEAQLCPEEVSRVCQFFRCTNDPKFVKYRDLCDGLENGFNIRHLEKLPTHSFERPPPGALGRCSGTLSEDEKQRVLAMLTKIAQQVRERRLMMYQYFKDFDRSKAYTRVITKNQFARCLQFVSIQLSECDVDLLCKAFKDPQSGDVNYPGFVQAVDELFEHSRVGENEEFGCDPPPSVVAAQTPPKVDTSSVNLDDMLARIRHIALVNRLRIREFFEDFDGLRSGLITKTQFRRVLSNLGFSKLGQHDLTPAQFEALSEYYKSDVKLDHVIWTKFMNDVESVFTQPNLEKDPNHRVPEQDTFLVPTPGTMDWRFAAADHVTCYDQTMERLRGIVEQRRILALPIFEDFDPHRKGHTSRAQFRQAMAILGLSSSETELVCLEARFSDDTGYNYRAFLNELEPPEKVDHKYPERMALLRKVNNATRADGGKLPEFRPGCNLEDVLFKVKNKVVRERIRMDEFMRDYDKLASKRMLKSQFRRAMDICRFELSETELSILEDRYQSPTDKDKIDYQRFVDEVDTVFTQKHLDKMPTHEPSQYVPRHPWELNELKSEGDAKLYNSAMERVADKVRQHRMQLFPLYEDFDRIHSGHCSRKQFQRVLTELEINPIITQLECDLVCDRFSVRFGGRDDVNYVAFVDCVYDMAGFLKRIP